MAVTMKNTVFWDTDSPVRTSRETHYFSATEPSLLMLCTRCQGFTAVTMKNTVFWDTARFVPHEKHITSPLQSTAC
jgi:hypothetical protein